MKLAIGAALIAFVITAVLGKFTIPWLRRLKFGQTEREEGVQSHLAKTGTPTMGGIVFLAGTLVASIVCAVSQPHIIPALILTFGFGLIGFIDDYLKVVKKSSDGLLPWQKLILQALVATLFLLVLTKVFGISLAIRLPFTGGRMLEVGVLAVILFYIVVLAVVNGVNFTDGLDGLASNVVAAVAVFFIAASMALNAGVEALPAAVFGGLLGFLIYNTYPAKVFMGDTGSLALGGFVAGMAYVMQMPLHILMFGIIFAIELLSVVIQVTYFKATHGKRIFRMTPIHHHFELGGWSEPRIVAVFTIVTIAASAVCYLAL